MRISSDQFKFIHEHDSYEELLAVRDGLLEEIRGFEEDPVYSGLYMDSSPWDAYLSNLECLEILCGLIREKFAKEFLEEDGDE